MEKYFNVNYNYDCLSYAFLEQQKNKIRLVNVTGDTQQISLKPNRNIQFLKLNYNGNLLACIYDSIITIYDSRTGKKIL